MSFEGVDHSSKEYKVQCLSELTVGGTLLKAGRSVSGNTTNWMGGRGVLKVCLYSSTIGEKPLPPFQSLP